MAEWKRAGSFAGKGRGDKGGFKSEFKRGSFGKPRFGGGAKKSFGKGDGEREMFDAVCSTCGADCQVPFKPNGKTPILCKKCFAESNGEKGDRTERRERKPFDRENRFGRDDRRERPQFNTRTSFKDGREKPSIAPERIEAIEASIREIHAKLDLVIAHLEKADTETED